MCLQDQIVSCLPCPGRVTALQCTHDGVYCVAAISEKLYIWQVGFNKWPFVISCQFPDECCMCSFLLETCLQFCVGITRLSEW